MPDQRTSDQILIHFYRAVVSHADVWRQRTDATTNWAAATSAGMITIAFSEGAPHFLLLLALGFDTMFLLMESRRFQMYDLWRRRFHWLNRYFIVPALSDHAAVAEEIRREKLDELARDLGRTVPHMRLAHAVGYRVRRNYGYLFAVLIFAWGLKVDLHPTSATSFEEFVRRAHVGLVPGELVLTLVIGYGLSLAALVVWAPPGRMIGWTETPSWLHQWRTRLRVQPGKELEGADVPPPAADA